MVKTPAPSVIPGPFHFPYKTECSRDHLGSPALNMALVKAVNEIAPDRLVIILVHVTFVRAFQIYKCKTDWVRGR